VRRLPGPAPADPGPAALAATAAAELSEQDPELYRLLADDLRARTATLDLVAATSLAPPSVLACAGSALSDVTAEGYPGARLHAGCAVVDQIERLAVARATAVFRAEYANVQPSSGSAANLSVYFGLLEPGDTILGLDVDCGGHPTHGALTSVTGRYFTPVSYGLNAAGRIDYARVHALAERFRPKLIVCGGPAYPRVPDFAAFRRIADEVGAFLLADISAVAGLVAAGAHPSPIDHAHVTTASTRAQLCGPRGGLILLGADADSPVPGTHTTLRRQLRRAVYPIAQTAPDPAAIAATARALSYVATPEFRRVAASITAGARAMAARLVELDHDVLTGGTDNHLVLMNAMASGMTGYVAEQALEACGILVSRTRIPWDVKPARLGSGIRFGSVGLALRGLASRDMVRCVDLVHTVLRSVTARSDTDYVLPDQVRQRVSSAVRELSAAHPVPGHPTAPAGLGWGPVAAAS